MEYIIQPNDSFEFSNISLAHPTTITGGSYFTKINNLGKPLYIQTPKSLTKQGFVKNGKKIYTDLMFDNNDKEFINWIENLETKCQELIFEKNNSWFENPINKIDIETAFTSPMRIYKSGKFYIIRVNIKVTNLNVPMVKIYNENETSLTIDDVNNETNIISILEIQGIKFTSRNFQFEIELKQSMVLNSDTIFESCLIKTTNNINKKQKIQDRLNETEENVIIKMQPINNTETFKTKTPIDVLEKLTNEIIDNEESEIYLNKNPISLEENNDNIYNFDNDENDKNTNDNDENDHENDDENMDTDDDDDDDSTVNEIAPIILGDELKSNTIIVNKNSVRFKDNELEELEEIDFNIQEKDIEENNIEDSDELKEFDITSNLDSLDNNLEDIKLKKPNQVYYDIYKQARKKAKEAKKNAIFAFMEAKNIKKTYMLNDLDESDSDSDLDNIK